MARRALSIGCVASVVAAVLSATAGVVMGIPMPRAHTRQNSASREGTSTALAKPVAVDLDVAGVLRASVVSAARVEAALRALPRLAKPPEASEYSYCILVASEGGLGLFERGTDRELRIASVSKVLTTAAALLALGPEWRFETKLVLIRDSTTRDSAESAYLVGGGDPYLVSAEFEEFWRREAEGGPATRLEELADQIAGAGIRSISALYADASLYDEIQFPPSMTRDLVDQHLLSPVSALSVDRNLVNWDGGIEKAEFASDPSLHAVSRLALALSKRGIRVGRTAKSALPPGASGPEFVVRSAPLREVIAFVNSHSDNFGAEMLAKRVAATAATPGSWSGFWPRGKEILSRTGAELAHTWMDEGSGVTGNRSTCADITSLLVGMRSYPSGRFLLESLATPQSPGTLQGRLSGSPGAKRLHAKTGSLRDVSALVGFVEVENASDVVFSVLSNGPAAPKARVELEDPVVESILSSTES